MAWQHEVAGAGEDSFCMLATDSADAVGLRTPLGHAARCGARLCDLRKRVGDGTVGVFDASDAAHSLDIAFGGINSGGKACAIGEGTGGRAAADRYALRP